MKERRRPAEPPWTKFDTGKRKAARAAEREAQRAAFTPAVTEPQQEWNDPYKPETLELKPVTEKPKKARKKSTARRRKT